MVDPNTRNAKRTPVTLKIKFKSETLEQFIERYAVDVSQGGIFIRTKDPLAVGTQMKFEFQLKDASPLIAGEGTVVWTRENDPSRPAIAPGMGVRFDKLGDGSQAVLERILADKAKQQPQRPAHETTKPPLFTDTPTRVAPAPVREELLGPAGSGVRTPPRTSAPMPFHSDADEFDERAFEEATKVRSLEELAAQAAAAGESFDGGRGLLDPKTATTIIPPDELALRRQQARADSALADPPLDGPPDDTESAVGAEPVLPKPAMARESAPSLPSPPEKTPRPAPAPRLLDTSPSPRTEPAAGLAGASDMAAKTKLGLEPARVEMARPAVAKEPAAAKRPSIPPPAMPIYDERPEKGPSNAPMIIGALAVVALVAGGVWFFVLRDQMNGSDDVGETAGAGKTGSAGSALASGGSAGSAVASAGTGSGSAAAENPHPTPAGVRVATVVSIAGAAPANAVISIEDQSGPSPFTAQLEKGKSYTARVSAPGFVTVEVPIVGGVTPAPAKLVAKPRVLTIASEPAGAAILVDGTPMNKLTPADVDIARDLRASAGKTKVRVTLRKPGYRQFDTIVDFAGATESADKFAMTMPSASLVVAPVVVQQPRPPVVHPPQTGSGSDTSAGSAVVTPPTDSGSQTDGPKTSPDSGSASATPPPATTTPPATPPASAGAGSAEPEPDFAHRQ